MMDGRYFDFKQNTSRGQDGFHVCNCIGCCRECGMCRTSPKHTADKCSKVAELKSEIARVIND